MAQLVMKFLNKRVFLPVTTRSLKFGFFALLHFKADFITNFVLLHWQNHAGVIAHYMQKVNLK